MANYLDYLYQRQRGNIQPGLLGGMGGSASNGAAQMAQAGEAANAQAAQGAQRVQAAMQQNEAEAARGLQEAEQRRKAEEAAEKQTIMQLGMLLAGGLGGGGEAATGGAAGDAVTEELAKEGAEKAMAEIAPKEFLESQVANPESFLFDPVKALENGASFQDLVRPTRGGLLGNVGWSNGMRW